MSGYNPSIAISELEAFLHYLESGKVAHERDAGACVLTALLRMNQHLFLGITPSYSHQQCVQDNVLCHPELHGPADNFA